VVPVSVPQPRHLGERLPVGGVLHPADRGRHRGRRNGRRGDLPRASSSLGQDAPYRRIAASTCSASATSRWISFSSRSTQRVSGTPLTGTKSSCCSHTTSV